MPPADTPARRAGRDPRSAGRVRAGRVRAGPRRRRPLGLPERPRRPERQPAPPSLRRPLTPIEHTPAQHTPPRRILPLYPPAAVPAGAAPMEQWYGNGHARPGGGHAPDSGGVYGLEMFAADAQPADPFEAVAPFGPEAPLTRPPREQSRLVLLIVAVLLVLAGVVAFRQLVSFHPAALITTGGGAPVTPPGAKPAPSASTAPSTSASAAPSPSASPVTVAGVQAIDPEGDNSENNDLAARAIDGDPDTAWRSERYDSPQFGGIKKGVGLAVDLGDPVNVTGVTLTAPGSDGLVEVRSADSPDYNGSSRIAKAGIDGSGHVVLTTGKPVTTRYLIVWFTRAPQQSNGENRVIVNEIDVR